MLDFLDGGFVGSGDVFMIWLICGKCVGALSGLQFFILVAGPVLYPLISFFSVKILTRCCKGAHFLPPISSIGITCVGFVKNVPISDTSFVMEYDVDMKGILVDFGKN